MVVWNRRSVRSGSGGGSGGSAGRESAEDEHAGEEATFAVIWLDETTFKVDVEGTGLGDRAVTRFTQKLEEQLLEHYGEEEVPELVASTFNFSRNDLTDAGLCTLLDFLLRRRISVEKVKFFRNQIGDEGARAIGRLLAEAMLPVQELHLSHNRISEEGMCVIFEALDTSNRYPCVFSDSSAGGRQSKSPAPLWLRVEYNSADWNVVEAWLKDHEFQWATALSRDGWKPRHTPPVACLHSSYRMRGDGRSTPSLARAAAVAATTPSAAPTPGRHAAAKRGQASGKETPLPPSPKPPSMTGSPKPMAGSDFLGPMLLDGPPETEAIMQPGVGVAAIVDSSMSAGDRIATLLKAVAPQASLSFRPIGEEVLAEALDLDDDMEVPFARAWWSDQLMRQPDGSEAVDEDEPTFAELDKKRAEEVLEGALKALEGLPRCGDEGAQARWSRHLVFCKDPERDLRRIRLLCGELASSGYLAPSVASSWMRYSKLGRLRQADLSSVDGQDEEETRPAHWRLRLSRLLQSDEADAGIIGGGGVMDEPEPDPVPRKKGANKMVMKAHQESA